MPQDESQPVRRSSAVRWPRQAGWWGAVCLALAGLAWSELQTSALQARALARYAGSLAFGVEHGPSDSIRFPATGPADARLGYSRLPEFVARLCESGYVIDRQARVSASFRSAVDHGLYPIYREKTRAGLRLGGATGETLYAFSSPARHYPDFESVPPLVAATLVYIENRELLDERQRLRNPAIEWDRLAHAAFRRLLLLASGGDGRTPGGSTLATQIEKFRHSPGGRTDSVGEKLRQVASASLRAYLDGEDTLAARRRIVVDYLNTVPLAAAEPIGEVIGLGDGLHAWFGADFDEVNASLRHEPREPGDLERRARAYRQVLSLLIAQRRPSDLLSGPPARLARLTDRYLVLLARAGIVDPPLLRAALATDVRAGAPVPSDPAAANTGSRISAARTARACPRCGRPSANRSISRSCA